MLGWRRPRFKWDSELIYELLRMIARIKLSRDVKDTQI